MSVTIEYKKVSHIWRENSGRPKALIYGDEV